MRGAIKALPLERFDKTDMKSGSFALVFGCVALVSGLFVFSAQANASPPVREQWKAYSQEDGTSILLTRRGDAALHWFETRGGAVVVFNKVSGRYEYAKLTKNEGRWVLLPSGVQAKSAGGVKTDTEKVKGEVPSIVSSKDLIPLRKQQLLNKKGPPPSR